MGWQLLKLPDGELGRAGERGRWSPRLGHRACFDRDMQVGDIWASDAVPFHRLKKWTPRHEATLTSCPGFHRKLGLFFFFLLLAPERLSTRLISLILSFCAATYSYEVQTKKRCRTIYSGGSGISKDDWSQVFVFFNGRWIYWANGPVWAAKKRWEIQRRFFI